MVNEFSRTELLLGVEGIATLKNAKVMVFGVGGVGSHCIDALARCGVGNLVLIDNDTVSMTNINRQSIAYHSTIGRYKTEVMKQRIADICPETKVVTYERFIGRDNLDDILAEKPDYRGLLVTSLNYFLAEIKKQLQHLREENESLCGFIKEKY